jgi:hypothetical protein
MLEIYETVVNRYKYMFLHFVSPWLYIFCVFPSKMEILKLCLHMLISQTTSYFNISGNYRVSSAVLLDNK